MIITNTKVGIWMDYTTAHIMCLNENKIESKQIDSLYIEQNKNPFPEKIRNLVHYLEKQVLVEYYKALASELKTFEHILLFGPSTAKNELALLMLKDLRFLSSNIKIKQCDTIKTSEMQSFLLNHFQTI